MIFFFHSALSSILVILEDRMYMHLPDCFLCKILHMVCNFHVLYHTENYAETQNYTLYI